MARFDQQGMSAGIEPRKAATKQSDVEIAALEIGAVHIRDFQFAAPRA